MKAEKFFTHPIGVIGSSLLVTFLWGSAFPIIKLSYAHLNIGPDDIGKQILFAGYRFFLAAIIIFLMFSLWKKQNRFRKSTAMSLVKIGLFQTFLQYLLFYIGLSYSTGIQGSIIAGTTSFFQILLAHFMYRNDALSWRKGLGLAVGFAGIVVVNMTKGTIHLAFGIGELLLLAAMLFYSYGNILAKNASEKMDVTYLTAYQMLFGGVGLIVVGALFTGIFPFHFDWVSFGMLMYLAIVSSVGFVSWNNVMKYNKVGKVSMYLFFTPVFGVILSSILLNEKVHLFVILGLLLVVSGIIIVNRAPTVVRRKLHNAS
ncbi:DMT family transporter [Bacillus paramycoides]|uniref:DMT family transporter n=1 Tax=Bacillus paramycoides TaxID=2026194 RepID=UPI003D08A803